MSRFKKATRQQLKLRMALDGPSGSGKSKTALRFAFALGTRIAVIDTENRSISKYQGEAPDGVIFDFDVDNLTDYSPTSYVNSIKTAGDEGYDLLIIDSLSHEWVGEGGALSIKDKLGPAQQNWKEVTPLHNRVIEAIQQSPCHIIATMRSKTKWDYEKDPKTGKSIPIKLGLEPIQRPETEYEFDIVGSIDRFHTLRITKSRCDTVRDAIATFPGADFMRPIISWLQDGAAAEPIVVRKTISTDQQARIKALQEELHIAQASFVKGLMTNYGRQNLGDLTNEQADQLIAKLEAKRQPEPKEPEISE